MRMSMSHTSIACCFRIDPVKADVFSLGVVLHRLIFQSLPFVDERDAASDEAVQLKVSTQSLPSGLHVPVQSFRKLSGSNHVIFLRHRAHSAPIYLFYETNVTLTLH